MPIFLNQHNFKTDKNIVFMHEITSEIVNLSNIKQYLHFTYKHSQINAIYMQLSRNSFNLDLNWYKLDSCLTLSDN